jgi:MFS transporter, DHA2 family, multidrug resistance protein
MEDSRTLQPTAEHLRYTPARRLAVTVGILIGLILVALDATIVNVAIPSMMGNLGVTMDQVEWVSTAYMLTNVIALPLCGWLEAVLGRRRLLIASVVLFTAASVLCGLATSFDFLIFARVLQGLGGAPLMATGMAAGLDAYPPQRAGQVSALVGIGVMVGPALGPILGGWLVDNYSWPWIFYVNILPGALATGVLLLAMLKPQAGAAPAHRIDLPGLLCLSLGLGCLQVMLSQGQREGWLDSSFIRWLLALSLTGVLLFVARSLTTDHPIVNLRVFRHRALAAGCAFSFVVGMALFGTLFLLPVFLQNLRQYTAYQSGIIMLTQAIASAVCMGVAGVLSGRLRARPLIAGGMVCCVSGMLLMGAVTYLSGPEHLFWPLALIGVGIGIHVVPLLTVSLGGLRGQELGDGSGLLNMMRQLGGSIGIALLATLVEKRYHFHHAILSEHISVYQPDAQVRFVELQQFFQSKGAHLVQAIQQSLVVFDLATRSQAILLAYEDVFLLIALIYALTLPLVFLFRDVSSKEGAAALPLH